MQCCVDTGTTIDEVIEGLAAMTANKVYGKFFRLHTESSIQLALWLDSWIKLGKACCTFDLSEAIQRQLAKSFVILCA